MRGAARHVGGAARRAAWLAPTAGGLLAQRVVAGVTFSFRGIYQSRRDRLNFHHKSAPTAMRAYKLLLLLLLLSRVAPAGRVRRRARGGLAAARDEGDAARYGAVSRGAVRWCVVVFLDGAARCGESGVCGGWLTTYCPVCVMHSHCVVRGAGVGPLPRALAIQYPRLVSLSRLVALSFSATVTD